MSPCKLRALLTRILVSSQAMQPVGAFPKKLAQSLKGVFTDIDGTLTHGNKLTADAYFALWRLKEAGLRVVPVTGRPAGWCDLIARQWPVDGVVGENGALAFFEEKGALKRLFHPEAAAVDVVPRLEQIKNDVLAQVPGSRVAKDQRYRQFDLAIDFAEEAPDLGLQAAEEIKAIFERHGAHAKISSIHVNGWFGRYDKLSMVRLFAEKVWRIDLAAGRDDFIFCGDSPNDEPMFAFFPNSCAVANIEVFRSHMKQLPRFVASRPEAAGFSEIVDMILRRRGEAAHIRSQARPVGR
jgi:1,2-diacylglycerol 3-alpha-glucosyltransferase